MTTIEYDNAELVDGDLQKSWPLWKLSNTLLSAENRILEFRLEGDYDKNGKNVIDYLNTVYSCVTSIATNSIVETYGECDKYDYIIINTGDVLIVDFNIPDEKRKDLIDVGYNQTMEYFKQALPNKKNTLIQKYSILYDDIKDVITYLERKNILQAKIALGQTYMDLCEFKPQIDDTFYVYIQNAKFRMINELKPSTIFRKYPVNKVKSVCQDFIQINLALQTKIEELKQYSDSLIV